MPIFGAVTLYSSLLTFTLHVHPDRLDYADQVLVCLLLKYRSICSSLLGLSREVIFNHNKVWDVTT